MLVKLGITTLVQATRPPSLPSLLAHTAHLPLATGLARTPPPSLASARLARTRLRLSLTSSTSRSHQPSPPLCQDIRNERSEAEKKANERREQPSTSSAPTRASARQASADYNQPNYLVRRRPHPEPRDAPPALTPPPSAP